MLGLINIKVLAAGSLFLGDVREPITSTKDGPKAINSGYFRSLHVLRQYNLTIKHICLNSSQPYQTQNGIQWSIHCGRSRLCHCRTLLCRSAMKMLRGNITAKRVGTMVVKYGKSTNGWVNDATYTIHYGDIRHMAGYDAATMGLRSTDYARNSKGRVCR